MQSFILQGPRIPRIPTRWRTQSESATLTLVPSRPAPEDSDRPLTEAELAEKRRRLAMLHVSGVAEAYRRAHEECRMDGDRLPRASAVQELVSAWRVLWKWRR
jgi:hypothetical protein